jgi:MHS family proline/betaine transporter-like MFS transporter
MLDHSVSVTVETPPTQARRLVVAATVGCLLEWYDFAVYGFFATTIAKLFFPAADDLVSLLMVAATFGVGFIMRPIGALVLGTLADRRGRKHALLVTVTLMIVGTATIAFAPTYANAGLLGPTLIVLARLCQGFSAGGEMGGATAILVEHAPAGKRSFYGSFQQMTQIIALLLGSSIGAVLTHVLTPIQLEAWGWRIPFIIGLLIGPAGLYIRSQTDNFGEIRQQIAIASPAKAIFDVHRTSLISGFLVTILWTVANYFFLVYMPTYAIRQLHLTAADALLSNSFGLAAALILVPISGILADRFGPKIVLMSAAIAITLITYPFLSLVTARPSAATLIFCQCIMGAVIGLFTGPAPAFLAALYPTSVRSTGISISYNFAVTLFGGFAPLIATWLIGLTGSSLAPSYYVITAGLLAILGVSMVKNIDIGLAPRTR